ncbi:O-antigen ligase [Serratia rubidaea]|uniref:O-antigen ligase family protein n=1 Tax=Serratia rubidaea TaxID=61652 RepID=UPI0006C766B8|nr:O-antigen ligase family protein [Serratia rubidaea]QPR64877.1 O-antigen ligase family protein [Serratia rubidaea]CAI1123148.1 O-antigen ligase [Serratia rubidaea]CAI1939679.1 O-antigen ligase [Serratia rubidaea]HAY0638901.1 O-antigen ligase family protein [Serratia rubidaea]
MLRKLSTANLAAIALLFTIIAASTSLTDSTITRNAFYLAVLFATAAFAISKSWVISRDAALTSMAVFCIGLSQAVWLWRFPASGMLETHNEYLTSATRLLCGAVLIMMLGSLHHQISHKVKVFAKGLLIFGFFYTSSIGLYLHAQSPDMRLQINTVSTITAYIYMLQSLLTVYVIHKTSWRYKYVAITIVILLSLWVIFLTETRATLLSYPLFLLLFFCRRHHLTLKTILLSGLIVVVMATAASHLFSTATARLTDIINEISNYQKGNGDTSLGSRISMWKAGIHTMLQSPGGQSTDVRFANATQYINSHEGGNPEALRNIAYHLHNDFIEAGSLQGIAGIIALLCFFSLVYLARRHMDTNAMLILLILPTILIGMVDTLFIDQRYVTNLTLMLVIYLTLQPTPPSPPLYQSKEKKV